jgi:peptidoglycan/xylan/chitin deacetylase (PgdA/CDA1 family)
VLEAGRARRHGGIRLRLARPRPGRVHRERDLGERHTRPRTGRRARPHPGHHPYGAGGRARAGGHADRALQPTVTPQPTATPRNGHTGSPPEATDGPRDRPNAALTFHGQGDPAQVRALLGELEQGGAWAIVLAMGSWLEGTPKIAKRILDGAHELGNHTQNHGDLASTGADDAFAEINACAAVLKRRVGSIGTWLRPSMTQYSRATIRAQAARVGYPTCLSYDRDSLDNTDSGAQTVARTVSDSVWGGSIVSMHCGHAGAVAAIPTILAGCGRRGCGR